MVDTYDGITIGDLVSELYLNSGTITSDAINKAYDLKYRSDLTAQDSGVKNAGATDNSKVFEVVERFEQQLDDNTDNIESLQTSTNTKLDTSNVNLVNIKTVLDALQVLSENHICLDNTTTTPLDGGETFTGVWQDCLDFQEVNVSVDTDKDSATNGLVIQWSADGTTVADTDVFSVYANAGTNYTPNPAFRYVRVVYTNGATPQTRFNLMTILRRGMTGGSFHRITDTLKDDSDGRLNLSVLKLRTAANTYVSGSATSSGNFKVSLEEFESQVSTNENTQLKITQYDESGNPAEVDDATNTLQVIPYEHHEIHAGSHFFYTDFDNDVDTGSPKYYRLTTPNTTKWVHLITTLYSDGAGTWELFENPTVNAAGNVATTFNSNRNSATTAGLVVATDPTSTSDGTLLMTFRTGSGTTLPTRIGSENSRENEIILKQNEDYFIKFTPDSDNAKVKLGLEWYEHTNS